MANTMTRINAAQKRQQQETAERQSVREAVIKFHDSLEPEISNVQRFQAAAMIIWLNDKNRYAKPDMTDVELAEKVKDETKDDFEAYVRQMEADRARRHACQHASEWFSNIEKACERLQQDLARYREEICNPDAPVKFTDRATQLSWAVNEVHNMVRNLPYADAIRVATDLTQAFADERPER